MVEPSSSDPAAQSADEVERALFECLEQAHPPAAIDAVCRSRPEIAEDLRRRYAWIAEHGTRYQTPELPEQFGEFRLMRRLGTGGMGVVHLAVQERLGREVALKVLRPEYLHFPRARERFEREARAASRLDHAGICQVYEAGEVKGQPYIAMRYVRGRTLAETIAESRASGGGLLETTRPGTTPARAGHANTLEMIERVARALDVAHTAGLVHRDVKPGNIMIEPDGNPVVLDFGLVRDETTDANLTRSAEWLGTPSYMAPEQISPRGRSVDRRTDVYGLGVTLYECLTLRCPFEAETRENLCRSILTDEPKPPSRLSRHLPRDLDVVLAKALDKDPERRYTTALELAEPGSPTCRSMALRLATCAASTSRVPRAAHPWT